MTSTLRVNYITCFTYYSSSNLFFQQYKHGVFLEQLDGVTCLPGDRDQPDQILWYEVETSEGCVPDNMIGITLSSGEFARRWKGIVSTLATLDVFLYRCPDCLTYLAHSKSHKFFFTTIRFSTWNVFLKLMQFQELVCWSCFASLLIHLLFSVSTSQEWLGRLQSYDRNERQWKSAYYAHSKRLHWAPVCHLPVERCWWSHWLGSSEYILHQKYSWPAAWKAIWVPLDKRWNPVHVKTL